MDIFKFAMDKEKYSELYYRDLAQRSSHEGLRNILNMLADEEAKHYHTVEQMKAGTAKEVADTPVLATAREVFEKMRAAGEKFDFHISEADLYRKAAKIEEESKKFYEQKAQEATDPAQKKIFEKLAIEEDKHLYLVDRLASFVSRPETFLENAEMYHFNDYVGGEF
jgi:rubrerythrin